MTRNAAVTTISPLVFSPGNVITAEDQRAVAQMGAWAGANRWDVYAAVNTGDDADLVALGTSRIVLPAATGVYDTYVRFAAFVQRDCQQIQVALRINVDTAGTTVLSRVTVGSATAVVNTHTSAGNGADTVFTVNTSSSGVGMILVIRCELQRQSGASVASLNSFMARGMALATLPMPAE